MIKNLITCLTLATATISIIGCGEKDPQQTVAAPEIKTSVSQLDFSGDGDTKNIDITTSREWDAVSDDSWIGISKKNATSAGGTIVVTIGANSSKNSRTGTIIVRSGAARARIAVTQEGRASKPADPSMNVPEGYELVWADEFDGNSLNPSDWTHEVWEPYHVNNELQAYVNGSFNGTPVTQVEDGKLKITCFKAGTNQYKSGRVYAHVNEGWCYGIFEARIKLPKGRGTWPAFWMLPANNDWSGNPWPRCGEIDIMEEVGFHPDYTSSSIHCEAYNHTKGTQKTSERYTQGAESDFHTYRLEWTKDYMKTYVDGNLLFSFNNDGRGDITTWPFKRNFYIILNLAWGGMWGGQQGVDDNALPATMEVDYVRVFQKD